MFNRKIVTVEELNQAIEAFKLLVAFPVERLHLEQAIARAIDTGMYRFDMNAKGWIEDTNQ